MRVSKGRNLNEKDRASNGQATVKQHEKNSMKKIKEWFIGEGKSKLTPHKHPPPRRCPNVTRCDQCGIISETLTEITINNVTTIYCSSECYKESRMGLE